MFDGTSDSLEKGSARTSRIAIGRNQMIAVHSEREVGREFATPRLITSMESKDVFVTLLWKEESLQSLFLVIGNVLAVGLNEKKAPSFTSPLPAG